MGSWFVVGFFFLVNGNITSDNNSCDKLLSPRLSISPPEVNPVYSLRCKLQFRWQTPWNIETLELQMESESKSKRIQSQGWRASRLRVHVASFSLSGIIGQQNSNFRDQWPMSTLFHFWREGLIILYTFAVVRALFHYVSMSTKHCTKPKKRQTIIEAQRVMLIVFFSQQQAHNNLFFLFCMDPKVLLTFLTLNIPHGPSLQY